MIQLHLDGVVKLERHGKSKMRVCRPPLRPPEFERARRRVAVVDRSCA
jgi:hypothetical protein